MGTLIQTYAQRGRKNTQECHRDGECTPERIGLKFWLKSMEILRRPGQYGKFRANGERLMGLAGKALRARGVAHRIVGHPTLFEVVFTERAVSNYRDFIGSDLDRWARYNRALLEHGIFKLPGKWYASLALEEEDFVVCEEAFERAAVAVAA